jgi:hypothetical protein
MVASVAVLYIGRTVPKGEGSSVSFGLLQDFWSCIGKTIHSENVPYCRPFPFLI